MRELRGLACPVLAHNFLGLTLKCGADCADKVGMPDLTDLITLRNEMRGEFGNALKLGEESTGLPALVLRLKRNAPMFVRPVRWGHDGAKLYWLVEVVSEGDEPIEDRLLLSTVVANRDQVVGALLMGKDFIEMRDVQIRDRAAGREVQV